MSIIAFALRVSAVQALIGAGTLARDRVFDSALLPIEKIADDTPEPFCSISTEDEGDRPASRDLQTGARSIDFLLETAIAKIVPVPGTGDVDYEIALSDANLEFMLSLLGHQINSCLWGGGGGEWGDIFRALSPTVIELASRRGVPTNKGERFAARQTLFRLRPLAEPAYAQPLVTGSVLARLLSKMDETPALLNQAQALRSVIEGKPVDWPEYFTRAGVNGGLTEDQSDRLGIRPLGGYPAAPLESIRVDPDGTVYGQEAVEQNLPSPPDG